MIATSPGFDDFTKMATIYNLAISPFYREFPPLDQASFLSPDEILEMKQTRHAICAKEGFNLYGYVALHLKHHNLTWINGIYVHPDQQGKGIGSFLLNKVDEFARATLCPMAATLIEPENTKAITFFEKNGYIMCHQHIEEYPYDVMLGTIHVAHKTLLAKTIDGVSNLRIQR